MARPTLLLAALCAALCATSALAARLDGDTQQLLRDSLSHLHTGRELKANSAFSQAVGGQMASASATAGPQGASTSQFATGPGSQVQGISQVGAKVDVCQRGPANSAECQTLTTADRSSLCSDIAPDTQFTCAEQVKFGKCDADFIFLKGFCLKSCNRCGSSCADQAPSGVACSMDQCNSTAVTAGPYCLKMCGRCSAAA